MKYATVMVGLALGQSNEARLEIAGQLAERFGVTIAAFVRGESMNLYTRPERVIA